MNVGATSVITPSFKMPSRAKVFVQRPEPIHAIRMDVDFEITSPAGKVTGKPGDYLAQNDRGEFSVMSEETLKTYYEEFYVGKR